MATEPDGLKSVINKIRSLYNDNSSTGHRFRYALLGFDLLAIAFVIVTSFFEHGRTIDIIDMVIGVIILVDFSLRMSMEKFPRVFFKVATWADIVAMVSFLAPIAGEGLGFLRILRTLRLLHTYQLLARLRRDVRYFRTHEEVIMASINLMVFLFITTGLIYALQFRVNPEIQNYADALYFTVTTLTTTGFGDITLTGTTGRLLSVGVMIVGVTLFLRLAQVLFRPAKVKQPCSNCGLQIHDADAVHCKHCGETIFIETDGRI